MHAADSRSLANSRLRGMIGGPLYWAVLPLAAGLSVLELRLGFLPGGVKLPLALGGIGSLLCYLAGTLVNLLRGRTSTGPEALIADTREMRWSYVNPRLATLLRRGLVIMTAVFGGTILGIFAHVALGFLIGFPK